MTDHIHTDDCWMQALECAWARIRDLERTVAQLENGVIEPTWMRRIREGSIVPCGEDTQTGAFTHTVTLKLHGPGPTHSHHNDEPPSR